MTKNKGKDLCRKHIKYEKLKPQRQIFHDSWASVTKLVHAELLLVLFKYVLRAYTIEMKPMIHKLAQ